MDVGEYETNTLVVNNIASVAFRVYRPSAAPSSSIYPFSVPDVERVLRSDGHLVFSDSRRQGIWCFRLIYKEGSPAAPSARSELTATLDAGPFRLQSVDDGSFDPTTLLRGRPPVPGTVNTPSSHSTNSSSALPVLPAFDSASRAGPPLSLQQQQQQLQQQQLQQLQFQQLQQLQQQQQQQQQQQNQQHQQHQQQTIHPPLFLPQTFPSDLDARSVHSQATAPPPLPEPRIFPLVSPRVVYNFFIAAILAGLSSAYCLKTKAIALNGRTCLLPPLDPLWDGNEKSRADGRALVATLRANLTMAGSLVLGISHAILNGMGCSEWACYAGIPPDGCPVLTAPWGKFATVRGLYSPPVPASMGSFAVGKARRKHSSTGVPHAWRSFAAKMLETRGVSPAVLHNSSWLRVEFSLNDDAVGGRPIVILWPSVLCFWSLESPVVSMAPFSRLDPLTDVVEAILEEKREAEAAAAASATVAKAEDVDMAMDDVPMIVPGKGQAVDKMAPAFGAHNFNASMSAAGLGLSAASAAATAAAFGAMYPTPPDGVSNPVGVTPTFDGSAAMSMDVDSAAGVGAGAGAGTGTAIGRFWDENEQSKREEEQDEPFIGEPEPIFGDPGEDIFGDDITDADFNFFDEKPSDAPAESAMAAPMILDTGMEDTMDVVDPVHTPSQAVLVQGVQDPNVSSVSVQAGPDASEPELEGTDGEETRVLENQTDDEKKAAVAEEAPVKNEVAEKKQHPAPPVFAKPELRHIRNKSDHARGLGGPVGTLQAVSGMKRPPSPFNAMTVYKRIRATLEDGKPHAIPLSAKQAAARRSNRFQGLKFTDFMIANTKKYEQTGKFGVYWPHPEADMASDLSSVTSPTAFRRPTKKPHGLSDSSPEWATLISSITRGLKASSLRQQPFDPGHQSQALLLEDSADSSEDSSEDSSYSEDSDSDSAETPAVAATPRAKPDAGDGTPSLDGAAELSRAFSEGVWDVPISRCFADPMPPAAELAYTDEDIIDVAQILVQQVTRMTMRDGFDEDESRDSHKTKQRNTLQQRIRFSVATLKETLPAALGGAKHCSLKPYLDVPDLPMLMHPGRTRQAAAMEQMRPPNLFPIVTPHVEIRRHEWTLSVAPAAVNFWEVLALEPLHGTKDIRAVCVYPDFGSGLQEEVDGFLGRMQIVYESLRMGSHERLSGEPGGFFAGGMVSFDVSMSAASTAGGGRAGAAGGPGPATPHAEFSGADQVHKLAQALAAEDAQGKSLVVYSVYCPEVTGAIVEACLAFQRLSQLYEIATTSRNTEPCDLVLQLLPLSLLASSTSLVVPTSSDMLQLCLEVYDRCAAPNGGPRPSPAFLLEQPSPRMLDLRLSATPSVDVQRENSCIHVAYTRSADDRWVTAAWTDNSGWRQFSAAYWVGRKNGASTANSFADVAREIWDNTCAIVANLRVNWRAIITKCGPMEPAEAETWIDLARTETRASIGIALVMVDTRPSLELVPPIRAVSPTALSLVSAIAAGGTGTGGTGGTGGAGGAGGMGTPQTLSVFSPEQSSNNNNPVTPKNPGTPGTVGTPKTPGGVGTNSPVFSGMAGTPGGRHGGGGNSGGGNASANASMPAAGQAGPAGPPKADIALTAAGSDPNAVADIDGKVVLVDVADSAWGAVASHRLNTAATWVDQRPALASGYLVKRGGSGREAMPVVLEINIIRAGEGSSHSPRAHEMLVRELLSSFRGLSTLARARGILDGERDVRPWHVAAVERAARALCQWM